LESVDRVERLNDRRAAEATRAAESPEAAVYRHHDERPFSKMPFDEADGAPLG
jgi:hypothetical protein